jgi:hypothetical protein
MPADRVNQLLNDILSQMKTALPQVPEKVWKEVTDELHINSDLLTQLYVPLYDWYYTRDEVKQLITFYGSPLGKKLLRNAILIELEAGQQGKVIGTELVKRINERLRTKGYSAPAT